MPKRKGKDPAVRENLRTAVNAFESALRIAQQATQFFPPAASIIGGIVEVINQLEKTAANSEALQDLKDGLTFLTTSLLEPFNRDPQLVLDPLKERVDGLIEALEKTLEEVGRRADRSAPRRYLDREDDEGKILKAAQKIQSIIQAFKMQLNIVKYLEDREPAVGSHQRPPVREARGVQCGTPKRIKRLLPRHPGGHPRNDTGLGHRPACWSTADLPAGWHRRSGEVDHCKDNRRLGKEEWLSRSEFLLLQAGRAGA